MSQVFLVDLFGNLASVGPPYARILSVQEPSSLQTLLNGTFVIRVPDGVQVDNPTDYVDLLTQKYQGLLAAYPDFLHITYDDLLDTSYVASTSGPGIFGERGIISVAPGGTFTSTAVSLSDTPTQALVTWEVFSLTDVDPSAGLLQRTYTELASTPDLFTATVSFNGGTTSNATTDSAVVNINSPDRGNAFVIRLTNVSAQRLYLGSWAVLYT
jgi:hypothetical protein